MNIITLINGKKVGNFSSPHPFTFEDGSFLPGVSNDQAINLAVEFTEIDVGNNNGDIELAFNVSESVLAAMRDWLGLYENACVDVVFCPLPMIIALKAKNYPLKYSPFRAIRMTDRINKLVSIHKQCI